MPDKAQDMVEDAHAHESIETARSLPDAASAGQSLLGYAAINGLGDQDEIACLAYCYFRERQDQGTEGDADGDWFRAEAEVRRTRSALNLEGV
jgi:hypothetical protein